ncbi:MAG: SusC/RagA family TonB-linked outer membrane protein [Gemmatimonadaceae bacterium]
MRWKVVVLAVATLLTGREARAQTRSLSGTVTDSVTNEPVAAGVVVVKGTGIGTAVRPNGTWVLPNAPTGPLTLVIRSLGYRSREVAIADGATTVTVALARDVFKIDQVVVTGQATTIERRSAPNAVALVDAQDLAIVPTASIEQQLVGKVAGADIQQNSGAPGGGVQVRLRGVTSVNADAQPLYVVDGVVMSDVAIASNQNAITNAAGGANNGSNQDAQVNRIADLNPNDIESIEILKGASASAIYGGRASNGVVIVTTKRGRGGAPQVSFRQRGGVSTAANQLGARRFKSAAEVDAAFGAGTATRFGFQPGTFYDNEKFLTEGTKPLRETVASLSGGTENTQYFASGTIYNEEGIVKNSGYDRQALRVNLDQRIGGRAQLDVTSAVTHTRAQRALTNNDNRAVSLFYALAFTPSFIDLREKHGLYPDNPFSSSNPLQTQALSKNNEDVNRFTSSARLNYNAFSSPTQTLQLTGLIAADYFNQKNALFFSPDLQFEPQDGFPGTSLLSNSDNLNMNFDANVAHQWTPSGAFNASTSVGLQLLKRDLDISRIVSRGLVGGQQNVDAGTSVSVVQQRQPINNFGIFLQEQLQLLNDRATVSFGVRGDQSSLNADASKLYYFPKIAGSYRFESLGPLQELKLRAAYGESGNEPLFGQRYTALTATNNIGGVPGLVVQGNVGANDLRYERQREVEFGADGAFFNRRANFEATVYQKLISDLLLTRNLPPSSGFATEVFNGGKLRTRGIELALGIVPIQSAAVNWLFRTTFSKNQGIITELPVPSFATGGFGASLGSFQIEQGKSATQIVGTDTIPGVSLRVLGDANPDFRMSFTNDVTWRRLGARALVEWQQGSNIINLTKLLYDFGQNTKDFADPVAGSSQTVGARRLNAWGAGVAANYIEDASYVKLREVALYYDIGRGFLSNVWGGVKSARLSVAGRNLFVSTKYSGLDPEVSNFGNQAIVRNIDVAPYPPSRQFLVSLDFVF